MLKKLSRLLRIPFNKYSAFRKLKKFHKMPFSMDTLIDWAMKFPSSGYLRISSIQQRSEIMSLANAVAELKPKNILEIGTARRYVIYLG